MKSCTRTLKTYALFKNDFVLENYVIQLPLHFRKNLTKLRISAHNLAIETGRYSNIDIEKRLCFHCNDIESECHLIFECSLYNNERKLFVDSLSNFTNIPFASNKDTFCTLMTCLDGDLEVSQLFCLFLNNCFEKRRLFQHQPKRK